MQIRSVNNNQCKNKTVCILIQILYQIFLINLLYSIQINMNIKHRHYLFYCQYLWLSRILQPTCQLLEAGVADTHCIKQTTSVTFLDINSSCNTTNESIWQCSGICLCNSSNNSFTLVWVNCAFIYFLTELLLYI